MEKSTIGSRLQLLRKKAGISQKQLAEVIGVNQNTLSRYETNERQLPTVDAIRLADYFGVSCDYLLRGYTTENVQIGHDTGLSNDTIQMLKSFRDKSPISIAFIDYLVKHKRFEWIITHMLSAFKSSIIRRSPDVLFGLQVSTEGYSKYIDELILQDIPRMVLEMESIRKRDVVDAFREILDDFMTQNASELDQVIMVAVKHIVDREDGTTNATQSNS